MKYFMLSVLLFLLIGSLGAQPSEAEIRKQITNAGTIAIKFSKSTGTRQWNSDIGNWEYVRGVEVIRKSDYPGIELIVTGNVVYQYTGVGKYSYWKFRIVSNSYKGLANPAANDINDILTKNWAGFYGYYFGKITRLQADPILSGDPQWTWHNPTSVEFKMKVKFDMIASSYDVETIESIWNVRLYRDDMKGAWKSFNASMSNHSKDRVVLEKKTFTQAQIRDMEKQTLQFTMGEEMAKKQMASLPQVNVPEFAKAEDMVKYIHGILRNGTPEEFRAVMMKLLGPRYFAEGSSVQLSAFAEQLINNTITMVYKDKATYKQQYCQQLMINKNMSTRSHFYIQACINEVASLFVVEPFNVGYVEGVAKTKLKLSDLQIRVRQDQDAISFINSFSDRKKLCPND